MSDDQLTLAEAAAQAGVTPATLKRWARAGVIPDADGNSGWSPVATAHARIVARLRARGHSLDEIRKAAEEGRLAYGFVEDLFPSPPRRHSIEEVSEQTGLEPALIERIWTTIGLPQRDSEEFSDEDVQALHYVASVIDAGFPIVAFLQLTRVYGQTISQIADAETRLFHIYVHEPLMREGVPGLEMAEEMEHLARDLLPLASPLMGYVHQRFLHHYIEQDVVGHLEVELDGAALGHLRVAIAFADLAGYTRFTEEEGEEEALSFVERFVEGVNATLPEDSRVIKTIGDEVMVVGQDVGALTDWAARFLQLFPERPQPRLGLHYGATLYR